MDVEKIGVTLTDETFQTTVLQSEKPVLVAFWPEGCGSWHLLAPEVTAISEGCRGQAVVATLDVEAEPETPKRYGIGPCRPCCSFIMGRSLMSSPGWSRGRRWERPRQHRPSA